MLITCARALRRRSVRPAAQAHERFEPATYSFDNEVLGVPGDLDSVTLTSHGHLSMTAPGFGAVILDAGRIVVGPSGDIEFQAGPFEVERYFEGELSIVDDLCAALGTPNV